MTELIYQEYKHLLKGPAGSLETSCETAEQALYDICAIVCHPHPLFGGTMQNKVVTTLVKAYKELGVKHIIRFNFRGVGQSEGQYANGEGERDDLLAVIAWAKQMAANVWLAGFSFGSYVAASAAKESGCKQLTCIAPPVVNFNFNPVLNFSCPWLVVQGDRDEIVDASKVWQWLGQLSHKPVTIRMAEASHFFHGQLLELRAQLVRELSHYL